MKLQIPTRNCPRLVRMDLLLKLEIFEGTRNHDKNIGFFGRVVHHRTETEILVNVNIIKTVFLELLADSHDTQTKVQKKGMNLSNLRSILI